MGMKIKNSDMQEHLCEMMERLLDDELMKKPESAKIEIAKATAINELVSTSLEMQKTEQENKRIILDAIKTAFHCNIKQNQVNELLGIENKPAEAIVDKVS